MKITLLSGGTGTPKLLDGLCSLSNPPEISIVVNTGDDLEISGNLVCPDLDSVLYTCAGIIDFDYWYGIKDDTYQTHERIKNLSETSTKSAYFPPQKQSRSHPLSRNRRFSGRQEFMRIGDQDRATHITRTSLLEEGMNLEQVTDSMAKSMNIQEQVLPMSNDPVSTFILTDDGPMHFQEFWIDRNGKPRVETIEYKGIDSARAPDSVFDALESAVVIGPSNPVTSIGPILSLPGIKQALKQTTVLMVSPFVNDRVFSGPAGEFLEAMDYQASTAGVIDYYGSILDHVVLDPSDRTTAECEVHHMNTRMDTLSERKTLATELLRIVLD